MANTYKLSHSSGHAGEHCWHQDDEYVSYMRQVGSKQCVYRPIQQHD